MTLGSEDTNITNFGTTLLNFANVFVFFCVYRSLRANEIFSRS